jgi:hypothetical protein
MAQMMASLLLCCPIPCTRERSIFNTSSGKRES